MTAVELDACGEAWIKVCEKGYQTASFVAGKMFAAGLAHARANPQPVEYSGVVGDDAEYFGVREA